MVEVIKLTSLPSNDFKWYFEKKWVGGAMGNKTVYGDGLIKCYGVLHVCEAFLSKFYVRKSERPR